ncbi:MAG: DUF4878 domain-containing protein [Bacteroidetes bacterium]|nr:DUF4878 domain-containing protein [Bacteroidota bacterium]
MKIISVLVTSIFISFIALGCGNNLKTPEGVAMEFFEALKKKDYDTIEKLFPEETIRKLKRDKVSLKVLFESSKDRELNELIELAPEVKAVRMVESTEGESGGTRFYVEFMITFSDGSEDDTRWLMSKENGLYKIEDF